VKLEDKESCRVATQQEIANRIRKMARTRIILSDRNKPIMSAQLEAEIEAALGSQDHVQKWKEWGMNTIRDQGQHVYLYGPPGTGKTVIAVYMSKRIGHGMRQINMADIGGKAPGHTERMVVENFQAAKASGNQTIIFDECESVLWDRGRAGSDSMWMVGVIDQILMQVAAYKGSCIFCTNRDDVVDPALKSRCFSVMHVGLPEQPERVRLWTQKIPERFPTKLTHAQIVELAALQLVGRDIETAIIREASFAITSGREPTFTGMMEQAKLLAK
jgi:AAA+ superfamily predicted ATPase